MTAWLPSFPFTSPMPKGKMKGESRREPLIRRIDSELRNRSVALTAMGNGSFSPQTGKGRCRAVPWHSPTLRQSQLAITTPLAPTRH